MDMYLQGSTKLVAATTPRSHKCNTPPPIVVGTLDGGEAVPRRASQYPLQLWGATYLCYPLLKSAPKCKRVYRQ